MILCSCCHEAKPEVAFTTSRLGYSKHCYDCGVWLHLFRQVFPKSLDVLRNRENTRLRKLVNKPAVHLQEVWGIRRAA